jgi:uncharacterized glyoxalase superfamily protein PhnB
MSTHETTHTIVNRSAPTATVVPILVYEDVETAVDFLVRAFGFEKHLHAKAPDGRIHHAQLRVAEGSIIVGRQGGPFKAPHPEHMSQYVHVSVPDVDRHFAHAKEQGARILQTPHDMPFGERQYTAHDPSGHWWTFSQHIADVAPAAWGATEAPR